MSLHTRPSPKISECLNKRWLDRIAPGPLGECLYFFEHAVAGGGYLLGVNPFDQPGVETYKKEMFRLLGKP